MASEVFPAAIEYALMGWSVLPVQGKKHATPRGVYDATTDVDKIKEWFWDDTEGLGVGIACGGDRELMVIDINPLDGGRETIELAQKEHGKLPPGPAVATGGGGWHLYLRGPGSWPEILGGGVSLKALGSYVVAPPSAHPSGEIYRWVRPLVATPPPAPTWVAEQALAHRERNNRLTELARVLLTRGVGIADALELLCVWGSNGHPSLCPREVAVVVRSVAQARLRWLEEEIESRVGEGSVTSKDGAT